jgi:hypothetical protein
MKSFDDLPKSIKKTIRYIKQDVNDIEKLEEIERELRKNINYCRKKLASNKR